MFFSKHHSPIIFSLARKLSSVSLISRRQRDAGPPGPQRGTQRSSCCPCFGCWELALSCSELALFPIFGGDDGGGGGSSDALGDVDVDVDVDNKCSRPNLLFVLPLFLFFGQGIGREQQQRRG